MQAPSKLTTFRWDPKWIRIFNSLMRASIAATLVCDLTILTATVFTVLPEPLIPTASPLTTRPKHPAPSWIPKQFYIIAYEPSNKRYFICETEETYRVLVDFLGIPIACRMVTVQFVHPLVICYWFLSGSLQAVFLLPETLFCVSVQHGNNNSNVNSYNLRDAFAYLIEMEFDADADAKQEQYY